LTDDALFCETFLRVQDKDKRLVPLRLNAAQRDYLARRTGRDIVLKARQLGFSTLIQALFFKRCVTSTQTALTMCHLDATTQALRRVVERFYDHMPAHFRPRRHLANAVVTTWPDFDSEMAIATAGSPTAARGLTVSLFHGSEVAFWRDAQAVVAGALQAATASSWVVLESTANGAQGWFYEECMRARRGESTFTLHFYPWWWSRDYRLPVEGALRRTAEEARLANTYGLDDGQLLWRRHKIKELGERMFQQEYPESVEQAFLRGEDSVFAGAQERFYASPPEAPAPDRRYVVGVDWGQQSDYTAASVFECETGDEVALLRVRHQRWDEMRAQIAALAQRWRAAAVYVEKNAMGSVNAEALQDELHKTGLDAVVVGFEMTPQRKALLVGRLKQALEAGAVRLLDDPAANAELLAFASRQTPSGAWTYSAPEGGHDDTVIARMLALWAAERVSV
jgi:hypothetical protein